jgi:hypothetical protein
MLQIESLNRSVEDSRLVSCWLQHLSTTDATAFRRADEDNLDADGFVHLQSLITDTEKHLQVASIPTILNSFNDQVLYLDIFSKKVETYQGDYFR